MLFNGKKIYHLRWEQRLSLREVAVRMDNACTSMSINSWERGRTSPDARLLGKLATALGVDVGYFFE